MAIRNHIRAVTSVAALMAGLCAALPAHAGMNMEGLLEKLRDKGVLTEEEFQEMRQEAREARRAESLEKAQAKGDKEAQKPMLTGLDPSKDGFGFKSGDGNFQIKLVGRLHSDYRWMNTGDNLLPVVANDRDTASIADGFELRRARIGFSGFIYKDIDYLLQLNMTGAAPIVDEAYARFAFYKPVQLTVGRFKQPFSLEQLTSSNNIDFAERSYNDQNGVPAKKLGAMLSGEPIKGITYAASVFQEGFNEETQADGSGKRYAGRLTANLAKLADLTNMKDTVLHVGAAFVGGSYQVRPNQSSQSNEGSESIVRATMVGFRTLNRGLSNIYRVQVGGVPVCGGDVTPSINCPRVGTASEYGLNASSDLLGLEAAAAYGPFKVQGEYVQNRASMDDPLNPQSFAKGTVNSYYVQGLWNVTGEKWSDMYKGGVFGGVKPKSNYATGGGWGAIQIGVRYAQFDASDMKIAGGNGTNVQGTREQSGFYAESGRNFGNGGCEATAGYRGCYRSDQNARVDSYSLGINWILNPNAKFMFEYTRTNFGGETLPVDVQAGVAGATLGATNRGVVSGPGQGVKHEDLFSVRAQYNF